MGVLNEKRCNIYKTPGNSTIEPGSPPPPDLYIEGTAKSIFNSPSFGRNLAPTLKNPNPKENPVRTLNFDDS
jgi:hypothetical protein